MHALGMYRRRRGYEPTGDGVITVRSQRKGARALHRCFVMRWPTIDDTPLQEGLAPVFDEDVLPGSGGSGTCLNTLNTTPGNETPGTLHSHDCLDL
eukprot:6980140-Prymnesium_polylepis.1